MPVYLAGVNHQTASIELRERLAFTAEQASQAARELLSRKLLSEAVILSTCNRTELYGYAAAEGFDPLPAMADFLADFHEMNADELSPALHQECGTEAVGHLYRVASGMESMLLGEAEVLGQVRTAYQGAMEAGATGPMLNRLFQSALEVGKRVRTETDLGARPVSVAAAAVKLAERIFGNLRSHRALVLGAGTVSQQVAENLRAREIKGIEIVNRSSGKGEMLAASLGAVAAGWDELSGRLEGADIVVTSVASQAAVLTHAMVESAMRVRGGRALFVIDLGVPRNAEPSVGTLNNVYLYNVDDLSEIVAQNRQARRDEVPRAEAIVQLHIGKFQAWYANSRMAVLLEELRARLELERDAFFAAHETTLAHLSPEERHRWQQETDFMLDRLLREPADRLLSAREVSRTLADMEAVRGVLGAAREKS